MPVQWRNCVIMLTSKMCEVSSKLSVYVSRRWILMQFRHAAFVKHQRVSSAQDAAKPTAKHALKGGTVELEREIIVYSSSRVWLQRQSRYLSLLMMLLTKIILFGAQLNTAYYHFVFVMCREKTAVVWDSGSVFSLTSLHGWQEKVIAAVFNGWNSIMI